jgi:branched-chain amino acid transport system substrate-binding protein
MKTRFKSTLLVSFITITCVTFTLPAAIPAADTIKLGVAVPLSGDIASYGIPSARAAELVAKDINEKGGILGRKVEVLAEDDVCKPEVATNAATKLVSKGVNVVLGHICSGATKAALGIYKEGHVIAMSPSATNTELTLSGKYPNFYRTIGYDRNQAKLAVDFAVKNLQLKKLAVLHDKGDYGKGFAEEAKKDIEDSKKAAVVLFEGITQGAVDYSAVVQKIKQSGAEAVIYGGYHPEAASIVTQMRKKGLKTLLISDDGVKDNTFIKVAGRYAEGVYATSHKDTSKNPLAIAAIEAHRKAYGSEPGAFFLNGYAGAQALLFAIKNAGSTDYEKIRKALRTYYVDTPLGKIKFDNRGDAIGVGFSVYRVRNGAYVEVK